MTEKNPIESFRNWRCGFRGPGAYQGGLGEAGQAVSKILSRVLAKKRFLIQPPKEEEDEAVLSHVRNTKLYSIPELNVNF